MAELTEGYHPSLGVRTLPVYDSKQTHKTGTMSHMKGRDGVHCMIKRVLKALWGYMGQTRWYRLPARGKGSLTAANFLPPTKLQVLSTVPLGQNRRGDLPEKLLLPSDSPKALTLYPDSRNAHYS